MDLNLSKDGNYKIILLINDEEMKEKYYFSSSKKYVLEKNIWQKVCNESNHICRFLFIITYLNEEDSSLKINIQVEYFDGNDNIKTNIALIVILIIVSLILIVVIIFVILKCRKKNNNLLNNVNKMEGETELLPKSKE